MPRATSGSRSTAPPDVGRGIGDRGRMEEGSRKAVRRRDCWIGGIRRDVPPWRFMVQPMRSNAASACFAFVEGQFWDGFLCGNEGDAIEPGTFELVPLPDLGRFSIIETLGMTITGASANPEGQSQKQ